MAKKSRYVLGIEFFVYAENDKDAIAQATQLCKRNHQEMDNACIIKRLAAIPFGSLQARDIELTDEQKLFGENNGG